MPVATSTHSKSKACIALLLLAIEFVCATQFVGANNFSLESSILKKEMSHLWEVMQKLTTTGLWSLL